MLVFILLVAGATFPVDGSRYSTDECRIRAKTQYGWVCGQKLPTNSKGPIKEYASFKGVPYARQPVGKLRFQKLQPLQPWSHFWDASYEGPRCPQHDVLYGKLVNSQSMSEACIYANIHVPLDALPERAKAKSSKGKPFNSSESKSSESHSKSAESHSKESIEKRYPAAGLPIFVFIHGGGFAFGSGDSDVHGPEYLVSKGVIVVTFNYRLGIFGFLSLNSSAVPGNAGLRDMITLLKWVKTNARAFGGNPDQVTLAGQSAGGVSAHLLSMSTAAEGLFNKVIVMSGIGVRSFFSPSPVYADIMMKSFLRGMGINATNPDDIHKCLIEAPIEDIMTVNQVLQDLTGLGIFYPVIESHHEGVIPVIDRDPEELMALGKGGHIPMIIGMTEYETEVFRPLFEKIDIVSRIQKNPLLMVPPYLTFTTPMEEIGKKVALINQRYVKDTLSVDDFVKFSSDSYFTYPAMYTARMRTETGNAPVFLYQFAYTGRNRALEQITRRKINGATHIEDLTYIFKTNSITRRNEYISDTEMQEWMTQLFVNFIQNKSSNCADWLPLQSGHLQYQDIRIPKRCSMKNLTAKQEDMVQFYDELYRPTSVA